MGYSPYKWIEWPYKCVTGLFHPNYRGFNLMFTTSIGTQITKIAPYKEDRVHPWDLEETVEEVEERVRFHDLVS